MLIDDMKETLSAADGAGLAAPQVGVLRRIVIVDAGEGQIPMINPVILEREGEARGQEGCLSCEGRWGYVTRPERVKVEFTNEDGESVTMEGSGGILCPLCIDEADIRLPEVVKACGLGCLLIADAGLGTINGVGLTAYYLKQQGIALKGIIFNHYETGNLLHEDNRKMCEYYTGIPVVACVADGDTELSMDAETLKGLYA